MKHLLQTSLALVLALVTSHSVVGQTLVAFNFSDQTNETATLTASTVASNLSASLFSVSDASFTTTNMTTDSPPDTPAVGDTGSWDDNTPTKYFAFTVTPDSGYQVTITGISFDYRQTASGALNYQIDVGGTTDVASGTFTRDSAWYSIAPTVTSTSFSAASQFRIYGFNGGGGSFGIDRVTVTGSVSAIPEPSTYATIVGAIALGGALWKRRRRHFPGRGRNESRN